MARWAWAEAVYSRLLVFRRPAGIFKGKESGAAVLPGDGRGQLRLPLGYQSGRQPQKEEGQQAGRHGHLGKVVQGGRVVEEPPARHRHLLEVIDPAQASAKIKGTPLKGRVPGIEFAADMLSCLSQRGGRLYLLGPCAVQRVPLRARFALQGDDSPAGSRSNGDGHTFPYTS